MARLPRIDLPDLPQHLVLRGNNRGSLFCDDVERWVFLDFMKYALTTYGCGLHAYVLMTNHVHLLATGYQFGAVSNTMQSIGRRFVRFVNLRRKRSGTLFEGRFKASVVETDRYLLTCMRYIEANPVRAGMVRRPEDYPWSSFKSNASGDPIEPLVAHPTYLGLAGDVRSRARAYVDLFDQPMPEAELKAIRESVQRNRGLGGSTFLGSLEKSLGRPVAMTPHGGPREFKGSG